ncbi:acyltransferase family protein [Citrobacter freundii]|uniref:acyltransferase family protein n=1 Tax=Citrobacter freundii TaxID=546 RepID=UPI000E1E12A0|nr:acyltransferase [Citrobacter freundii]RDU16042.1 acyltransferase [Citrobacter freundii]
MNTFLTSNLFIVFAIIISMLSCVVLSKANFFNHINFDANRLFNIDGIRGIAATMVVMNHVVFILMNTGIVKDSYFSQIDYHVFSRSGEVGVQIFFCITAFLFTDRIIKTENKIEWKYFFYSRIKRLAPLYIFMITISLLIAILISKEKPIISIGSIYSMVSMYSFGFLGGDVHVLGVRMEPLTAVIWTLPYEWKFYAILPIAAAVISSRKTLIPSSIFVLIIAFIDSYINAALWIYFISGALVAMFYNKFTPVKGVIFGALSSVVSMAMLVILINTDMAPYGQLRFIIITALFSLIVMIPPSILKIKSLVYLGEISYSLYLMHLPIMFVSFKSLNSVYNLYNIGFYHFAIISCFIIALSSIISCLTFKYIEYTFIKKKVKYS